MRRAIPLLLLSAAGFVVVWRFEPSAPPEAAPTRPLGAASAPQVPQAPSAPLSPAGEDGPVRSVDGSTERTRWGALQVRAVFSGGRLVDVRMLRTPRSGRTYDAVPVLQAEVLTAQSANVDTVSGATMTSEAYLASLQAAIDAKGGG
jgi:uncharacterized protein with FMN-binding domain